MLVSQVLILPEKLHLRDADEDDHGGVDDMTKLTYLNEPEVLHNLERRYILNEIYVSDWSSSYTYYIVLVAFGLIWAVIQWP